VIALVCSRHCTASSTCTKRPRALFAVRSSDALFPNDFGKDLLYTIQNVLLASLIVVVSLMREMIANLHASNDIFSRRLGSSRQDGYMLPIVYYVFIYWLI